MRDEELRSLAQSLDPDDKRRYLWGLLVTGLKTQEEINILAACEYPPAVSLFQDPVENIQRLFDLEYQGLSENVNIRATMHDATFQDLIQVFPALDLFIRFICRITAIGRCSLGRKTSVGQLSYLIYLAMAKYSHQIFEDCEAPNDWLSLSQRIIESFEKKGNYETGGLLREIPQTTDLRRRRQNLMMDFGAGPDQKTALREIQRLEKLIVTRTLLNEAIDLGISPEYRLIGYKFWERLFGVIDVARGNYNTILDDRENFFKPNLDWEALTVYLRDSIIRHYFPDYDQTLRY